MPHHHSRWPLPIRKWPHRLIADGLLATLIALAAAGDAVAKPPAPSPTVLVSDLRPQLVPPDNAPTIAIDLDLFGSYRLPLNAPAPGHLWIGWYRGKLSRPPSGNGLLVASGQATYHAAHASELTLRPTKPGRRLIQTSRSLRLTAIAFFRPNRGRRVVVLRPFRLA